MEYRRLLQKVTQELPRFNDGRIDFTQATTSPILSVIPYHNGKILLLRRSSHVGRHKGLWSNISGFIDRLDVSLEELARHEMHEEAGILERHIKRLSLAEPYEVNDSHRENRSWLVFPMLAELHLKPSIVLNWEHTDYIWITPEQLEEYPRPSRLHLSINTALGFLE